MGSSLFGTLMGGYPPQPQNEIIMTHMRKASGILFLEFHCLVNSSGSLSGLKIIELHWKGAEIEPKIKFHDIPVVSCPGGMVDRDPGKIEWGVVGLSLIHISEPTRPY